jgi:hypothetical protein
MEKSILRFSHIKRRLYSKTKLSILKQVGIFSSDIPYTGTFTLMPSFILKSEHPKNLNGIRNSIREHDIFLIKMRPFPAFLSVIEDAEETS